MDPRIKAKTTTGVGPARLEEEQKLEGAPTELDCPPDQAQASYLPEARPFAEKARNPQLRVAEAAKKTADYGEWAKKYDADTASYGWCAPETLLDATLRHQPAQSHLRVLDVGVGTGKASAPFLDVGAQVVGLDKEEPMLVEARKAFPRFHHLGQYDIDTPVSAAGVKAESFDVVLSSGVLHFAADLRRTLGTLSSALAPGGVLSFTYVPTQPRRFGNATHLHPPSDVARMIRELGLELLEHFPFVAYYDKGDRNDPVKYMTLVARKAGAPPVPPPELRSLDRTASVDRAAVLQAATAPLFAGPLSTTWVDDPGPAQSAALLAAAERQVKSGKLELSALPLPTHTARAAQGQPGTDALLLFAHPDDESIYAGGTVQALRARGKELALVHATGGDGARNFSGDPNLAEVRRKEQEAALERLGLPGFTQLGFADFGKYLDDARAVPATAADTLQRWGLTPLLESLVEQIRTHRPRTLLSFDSGRDPNYSLHGHHLALGYAVTLAFHLAADPHAFPEQLARGLAPWAADQQQALIPSHKAGRSLDVAIDPEKKAHAVSAHASQRFSIDRLLERLAAREPGLLRERWHLVQARAASGSADPLDSLVGPGAAQVLSLPGASQGQLAALEAGTPEMRELYRLRPLGQVRDEILAHRYPREALSRLLLAQNRALGAAPAALENAARLARPDTVAVVTGQQVGLFGGPLYSLYKALATIHEARALKEQGIDAVPVFWMASYDHDMDEVNHAHVVTGAPEGTKLKLGGKTDQRMVGAQALGPSVSAALDQLEASLAGAPHLAEVMAELRESYRPDETFAQAFGRWFSSLLSEHGLVVLDPAGRDFMQLARPVLERELFGAEPASVRLGQASAKLEGLGFPPQVPPKSDTLNLFFVDDHGKRVALKRTGGGFETAGTPARLSDADVRRLLDQAPERFSPGALLRPLVEDAVLPTIGYVGGPSERKYYGQLMGLYDWAGLPAPRVLKRPAFYVEDGARVSALSQTLGLSAAELLGEERIFDRLGRAAISPELTQVYARFAAHREAVRALESQVDELTLKGAAPEAARRLAELKQRILADLDAARGEVERLGGGERLTRGLDGAKKELERAASGFAKELGQLEGKSGQVPKRLLGAMAAALGGLDDQLVKVGRQSRPDLVATVHRLRPLGEPQERQMNVAQLLAEHGRGVIELLLSRASVKQAGPELLLMGENR